ncbi:MAG: glycine reductase [Deltaproteobacteria bacterium]|jgi:glycine reductase|nr:glycine reductase [Deltaproteobacteria bacterium]
MRLELHKHKIENIKFGSTTRIENRTLHISKDEIVSVIQKTSGMPVDVTICRPGDKTRITNVLDIVEPRTKPDGSGSIFPGFLETPGKTGIGITNVLEGAAVVEVAALPRVQEGLIDMGGSAAQYSPFSQTQNVVLCFATDAEMEITEVDRRTRLAGLSASAYLAAAGLQAAPDVIETFELTPDQAGSTLDSELPRVAYICLLQSQGFLRETFVYGKSAGDLSPGLIHPNETMDGAIVSGNYVIPSNRNPTYFHLNNPVIQELYRRHQTELIFCGVALCNEHSELEAKEKAVQDTIKIVRALGAEGVVITKEGGGNADTDLMLMCQKCEAEGIRTVVIGNEAAGTDGVDPSLAHSVKEADAFVTTGNNDAPIKLDPVTRVIGRGPLPGITGDLKEGMIIPLGRINGATNLLGYNSLSAYTC